MVKLNVLFLLWLIEWRNPFQQIWLTAPGWCSPVCAVLFPPPLQFHVSLQEVFPFYLKLDWFST